MSRLVNLLESIVRGFGYLAAILVLPLIAAMIWEVFSRYVLKAPTIWAFEVSYMLMGSLFVVGLGYTLQMHNNVRVDFFYGAVSKRWRAAIDLLIFAMMTVFTVWLLFGLWDYLWEAVRRNETSGESFWNPPVWPFRLCFIIGFALFLLQLVLELIKCLFVLFDRDPPGCTPESLKGAI